MALKTDYKDDILSSEMQGKRMYEITYANGGKEYVSIKDISTYDQTGDVFGAKDINETNDAVNKKLPLSGGAMTGSLVFQKIASLDKNGGIFGITYSGKLVDILRMTADEADTLILGDGLYSAGKGRLNLNGGERVSLLIPQERIELIKSSEDDNYSAYFVPKNDNKCTLGTNSNRFARVYAGNATISTSDRREKENIIPLGESDRATFARGISQIDIHSELFDRLQPVQYNFIDGDGKVCYGLIAQDVISAMEEVGIGENELDLIHHNYHVDEETGEEKETFGIAYNNLIAMLIHEMQKAKEQIATLHAEVDSLKGL